ncbi:MAG: metallophosphoesterase [Proteobacteria bacterium]|nr:MAG: metallophosphoesterase [Pseudomonadota bacterium]
MIHCAAISDIHSDWDSVEGGLVKGGDILFIAGDLTYRGAKFEIEWALDQISTMHFTHKIVIAGNHDTYLQTMNPTERAILFARNGIRYLQDELLTLNFPDRRISIYGTPWVPTCGEFAFQGDEEELARHFSKIPEGLDVLLTHTPPYGILDENRDKERCGSHALFEAVQRAKPKLHLFGHIHEAAGQLESEGILFRNVSSAESWNHEVPVLFSL